MKLRSTTLVAVAAIAMVALVAVACGDDDSGTDNEQTATPAPTATPGSENRCVDGAGDVACDLAAELGDAAAGQDIAPFLALVDAGKPHDVTCTGEPGAPWSFTKVCEGAAPGERRSGFPLAMHGSEGTYLTADELKTLMADELARGLTIASTGCAVDGCGGFIVAFRAPEQPLAFYVAFEQAEDGVYALTGAGRSGDNAQDILEGGRTFTVAGEAVFQPW